MSPDALPLNPKSAACAIRNPVARAFAVNLGRLRAQQQWSVRQAAAKLGVAESTWSQWESGKRFPSAYFLALLVELFDVPACLLFRDALTCHGFADPATPDARIPCGRNRCLKELHNS